MDLHPSFLGGTLKKVSLALLGRCGGKCRKLKLGLLGARAWEPHRQGPTDVRIQGQPGARVGRPAPPP